MQPERQGGEANDEATRLDQHRPDEHRIRLRAYEIWEEEGRPDGRSEEHWMMAKWQLEGVPDRIERLADELGHEDEPG
jgi:hypothetical protein